MTRAACGWQPLQGNGEEELVQWPAAEQVLRQWLFHLGRRCATRPLLTLGLCLALVGACAAGLSRFRCIGWSAAWMWWAGELQAPQGVSSGCCHERVPACRLPSLMPLRHAPPPALAARSVMTDPQELWVGPGSQAAQEKAAYEV